MDGLFILSSSDKNDKSRLPIAPSEPAMVGWSLPDGYPFASETIKHSDNIVMVAHPLSFIRGDRMSDYFSEEEIVDSLMGDRNNISRVIFTSMSGTFYSLGTEVQGKYLDQPVISNSGRMRLEYISELEPDWDGYDGSPIDQETVQRATEFIKQCLCKRNMEPNIVPMSSGGIQLEWFADDIEIEVEIKPEGAPFVVVERLRGEEGEQFYIDSDEDMVRMGDVLLEI